MRAAFFAIASAWGFLAGMVALAMAQRSAGLEVAFDTHTLLFVVPGVVAACGGGWLAAAAYRENRRRH